MIINKERNPILSLYYLGATLIAILSDNQNSLLLDDLYEKLKEKINQDLHIDFFYYALDWLFIQSLVELQGGMIVYVDRKIDCAEKKPF